MNQFKIPADLGRIPKNIERGEGFSNYTADQWRIFFMIYATTSRIRSTEIVVLKEEKEETIPKEIRINSNRRSESTVQSVLEETEEKK
ncbi:hypothetical protein RhiirA4_483128 [Rhizophagus irregularis]|uniref:Uncharacterized protein n=1 Tax=Rhizophagus irregularis TaxID=588596 RepID=A0A2I1HM54_9GLOM|nr:hypothetical protein RhiirA4_483128 [Rhizophagus irregularis]